MPTRSPSSTPLRRRQPASVRRTPAASAQAVPPPSEPALPPAFADWFRRRHWQLRPHQLALLETARARRSALLIAPTGAGKTLAGFLPSLVDLAARPRGRAVRALHTLYISPLKALASDVARNLLVPVSEMGLPVRVDLRTGDTSPARKAGQRARPPDILLTTPEQLALLVSHADAAHLFGSLETVILDELHALAASKRGDLLALGLARLEALAPGHRRVGLSATVARPSELRAFLVPQRQPDSVTALADLVWAKGGAAPELTMLQTELPLPWAGHTTRYAVPEIYAAIARARLSLVFVNTRSQAELMFHELWRVNDKGLPIALHHGSLDAARRRKVEAAMAAGALRAVVATSTLDLGIDWGDVDLVINLGAPKGASRLIQRVGRANHRLDEPSRALLVPSNRFEVLECRAAIDAAAAGTHDAVLNRTGALDVLAQHVWGRACAGAFHPDDLFAEVRLAQPYAGLTRTQFDRIVDFVSTGGYALRAYERYARLKPVGDGTLRLAHPRLAQQYRMNVGTIIDSPLIRIRLIGRRGGGRRRGKDGRPRPLMGGRVLGELEEYFIEQLAVGDTFAFAGFVLRFEGLQETEAFVSRASDTDPAIPAYNGGKFPLSTHLAERVRRLIADPRAWRALPAPVCEWLSIQAERSVIPSAGEVLVETFPRGARSYLVVYPFEGRLAHQTLGMLLTRRLDRLGARPVGFVASDYALAVWALGDVGLMVEDGRIDLGQLFAEDMLGDDLDAWLAESSLMKRTFRINAVIAGLIERNHPGRSKSGRQVTVSSDLLYDVLRRHDPGHVLLEAAWADAASGLLDIARLGDFLRRIRGHIRHQPLARVSPLAVPVMLEIGREMVYGGSVAEDVMRESAADLIREAVGEAAAAGLGIEADAVAPLT
ncbi:MAG: ligase-associated DNA damage response DEXH box helicase [Hyphomicrobiaceae bacterium]|nr:ligase-associated DNA damage response DEXH box helicase [Hyphomicrobiaceae bacterium]